MGKRIAAIILVLMCTTLAWMVLGVTIVSRTFSSDDRLRGRVASTWGTPQDQFPPSASTTRVVTREVEVIENNQKIKRPAEERIATPLPIERTRTTVKLELEHRQKGLLWYSTYSVHFDAEYLFRNTTNEPLVDFVFTFPTPQAIYDDLVVSVNGRALSLANEKNSVKGSMVIPPGNTASLTVRYRSQGMSSWSYSFGSDIAQVRDFVIRMETDFNEIDFAPNTLSPTRKTRDGEGWVLEWEYKNLVTGYKIGMLMPEKLQPGPLAGRMSFFAPVSLLFFFFIIFIITTLRGIDLHPMNYFFLAAAFFAFHLLLAYLVDHISIHLAFLICAAVSIFLVVSYLRLVVGIRFAAVEAAGAQLIYLVLFSYAFFFEGFTGLTITIGAILTLFVVMQMTGRIRWPERFRKTS